MASKAGFFDRGSVVQYFFRDGNSLYQGGGGHGSIARSSSLLSLKLTAGLHLKMDGWNTSFPWGWPIFRGYVSCRECRRWHFL